MFRQSRYVAVEHGLTVFVTVTDLVSVQRVLVMLCGRSYRITRFEADDVGEGRWRLSITCTADDDEADLLRSRLERLPSVLAVNLTRGVPLAASS